MFFSIIVPVYNRERLIGRCLESLLSQDFGDFELVLVDDASTDRSLARMREHRDGRIRILEQKINLGVGPARNAGAAAARGDWIIFVDSDDELVPGALARIHELASGAPAEIQSLWFRSRLDDGRICPARLTSPREWDYAGFIGFLEETVGELRDMVRCSRRYCCERVHYPNDRSDAEKYLLDFARAFRIRAYPEALRLYHQDAENQIVRLQARLHPRRDREFVVSRADCFQHLLEEHGETVRRLAPRLYCDFLQSATTTATMAGRRGLAIGYALDLVRRAPKMRRAWLLLGASFVGPAAASLRRRLSAGT
jgi:glycosyltransferase involved in cell wall biosynthesis